MHMIDKAICVFNKFVVNFFASLTITVKTPLIDFSLVPLTLNLKGSKIKPSIFLDRRYLLYLESSYCINLGF